MPSTKQFISALEDLIERDTSLSRSPIILHAELNVKQIVDKVFSVEIQTENSQKDRSRDRILLHHNILISYVNKINPHDQMQSRDDALIQEEEIINSLLTQSNLPPYRLRYLNTQRRLSNGRDFYISTMSFDCEHYWELSNG